jgi:3-hydroxyacyl-[acyl-carrier-protein] dehydratase
MRWMWIDRFLEFERGKRAVARKNVSMVEEEIDEYISGFPHLPPSLIVEGLAQTAGLLVGEKSGFQDRVILAKVAKATFHKLAVPGDSLTYTAVLDDIKGDGAFCTCTSHVNGELQAEVELVFAMLDDRFPNPIFDAADFISMIRAFGLYDVAVDEHGQPLQPPAHLVAAEQAAYPETGG